MVNTSNLSISFKKKLLKLGVDRQTIKELEVTHKVLNNILQKISEFSKPEFKDKSLIPEFSLVITKEELHKILENKAWKNDSVMADNLGITRQRLSQIRKNGKISTQTAGMIAFHMGNLKGNWWRHFSLEIVDWKKANSPKWNHSKYTGEQPYERHSLSAAHRSLDNDLDKTIETK